MGQRRQPTVNPDRPRKPGPVSFHSDAKTVRQKPCRNPFLWLCSRVPIPSGRVRQKCRPERNGSAVVILLTYLGESRTLYGEHSLGLGHLREYPLSRLLSRKSQPPRGTCPRQQRGPPRVSFLSSPPLPLFARRNDAGRRASRWCLIFKHSAGTPRGVPPSSAAHGSYHWRCATPC